MRKRYLAALLSTVLLLTAACDRERPAGRPVTSTGTAPARPATAQVPLGKPFVHGDFKITVTKVALHQKALPLDAAHRARGVRSPRPTRGQFVLVYLTATNLAGSARPFSTNSSHLVDADGNRFDVGPYALTGFQQLGDGAQQPGATLSGYLAFDTPPTIEAVSAVEVQPGPAADGADQPTVVALR